jgi:hypothetical protein
MRVINIRLDVDSRRSISSSEGMITTAAADGGGGGGGRRCSLDPMVVRSNERSHGDEWSVYDTEESIIKCIFFFAGTE